MQVRDRGSNHRRHRLPEADNDFQNPAARTDAIFQYVQCDRLRHAAGCTARRSSTECREWRPNSDPDRNKAETTVVAVTIQQDGQYVCDRHRQGRFRFPILLRARSGGPPPRRVAGLSRRRSSMQPTRSVAALAPAIWNLSSDFGASENVVGISAIVSTCQPIKNRCKPEMNVYPGELTTTLISTLRLSRLPAEVALSAIGDDSPTPAASMVTSDNHCDNSDLT